MFSRKGQPAMTYEHEAAVNVLESHLKCKGLNIEHVTEVEWGLYEVSVRFITYPKFSSVWLVDIVNAEVKYAMMREQGKQSLT